MDSDDEYDQEYQDAQGAGECSDFPDNVHNKKNSLFQTLTPSDIAKWMNEHVDDVKSVVEMSSTTIRILLSHTKWDKYELLSKLTDESPKNRAAFFAKANVIDPAATKKAVTHKSSLKTIECAICFTECVQKETLDLGCGHEYCEDCWRQYLTLKITDDGIAESINCPAAKCGIIVDDDTIMQLITDASVRQKYQHLMINSFVTHNYQLQWCPAPRCDLAIKANQLLGYQQKCACTCGHEFCFNCSATHHDPIPCDLYEKWTKDSNVETAFYIRRNTKECPNCKSLIEKNGGCNHMTCGKCSHEFCWLCSGDWKNHSSCSSYQEANGGKMDEARLLHHAQQFNIHKESFESEKTMMEQSSIVEKIQLFEEMGVSRFDAQIVPQAVKTLCECRQQLMHMCFFGYFVENNNQLEMFELNQVGLMNATETLSRYLKQNITNDNAENIILNLKNKMGFCKRVLNIMNEHIYEGFEKYWWKFNKNL